MKLRAAVLLAATLAVAGCGDSSIEEWKERTSRVERRLDAAVAAGGAVARLDAIEARFGTVRGTREKSPAVSSGPSRGGIYRQGLPTDPPSLDPAHFTDTTSWRVALNLFDGLVEQGDDLAPAPAIARSWDVSPDGTVYTFHLADGVRFHNGRTVTAQDFVYSYRRLLEPRTASERAWILEEVLGNRPFAALGKARAVLSAYADGRAEKLGLPRLKEALAALGRVDAATLDRAGVPGAGRVLALAARARQALVSVESASGARTPGTVGVEAGLLRELGQLELGDFVSRGLTAPDRLTFRIELGRPFAPLLGLLTLPNGAVVPHEEVERLGESFSRHPVGTGPFRFVSWQANVSLELAAFPGHFRGPPLLAGIRFRTLPDGVARLNEFEVGNLDSVNEVPDEKYEAIRANPRYSGVLEEAPMLSTYYIGFNVTKKPFDDPLVRRAFSHAIRKDAILRVLRRGRGTVARGVLPPGMPGYDPGLAGYELDQAKARELLARARDGDPRKLGPIQYWYNAAAANDPNALLAEAVQQQLREIGVETKLASTDWGTYLGKLDRGEAPMFRLAWVAVFADPDAFLFPLFHSTMRGQSGNTTFYSNPLVDELLERARTTMDLSRRLALYGQAERLIVADAVWIPLFHSRPAFLRKPWVHGAKLTAAGPDAMKMRGIWLEEPALR
ncbi:MAG: ABC transporter substrate-binding protein [Candidatus Wallbacteria bacterium]|nr:ABC transporter substrate-binding protein [Candidatus Wallbacteria bacterium]